MKIKELFETVNYDIEENYEQGIYPVFVPSVQFQSGTSSFDLRKYKRILENDFIKDSDIYVKEHAIALSLTVFLPIIKNTTEDEIKKLSTDFIKFCSSEFDLPNHMIQGGDVWIKGVPDITLSNNRLNLAPTDNITSFKGIEKRISCKTLFLNLEKKQIGLLSILKIPLLENITNISSYPEQRKVVDILSKYIESKDILTCQDELIENGLKQYAKL